MQRWVAGGGRGCRGGRLGRAIGKRGHQLLPIHAARRALLSSRSPQLLRTALPPRGPRGSGPRPPSPSAPRGLLRGLHRTLRGPPLLLLPPQQPPCGGLRARESRQQRRACLPLGSWAQPALLEPPYCPALPGQLCLRGPAGGWGDGEFSARGVVHGAAGATGWASPRRGGSQLSSGQAFAFLIVHSICCRLIRGTVLLN